MQDEDLIERVLVNIIGNAKKYIPKTNGVVKVSITQFENFIQYEIEDNGPGIPEEQRLQVFDKFYQINQSKKNNVGGSGLGLSICKKIADLHNGFIHVDESSMGGAKFILQIPMKQHDNS
jgi:signal transduction histidine kinase